MARIRSVKPSLRTSRVVVSWPVEVRYFWVLLWGYLDDEGRGLDIPKTIAGDCYPLDDAVTASKVDRWLTTIATTKVGDREPPLCRYEVDGARYIHAVNWTDNQKVNRPRPSLIPPCPTHESFSESRTEDALRPHVLEGGKGKEEEGRGRVLAELISEPPSPWCQRHPGGTQSPCYACGVARQTAEAWQAERRAQADAAPDCPRHEGYLAHNCGACRSEQIGAA